MIYHQEWDPPEMSERYNHPSCRYVAKAFYQLLNRNSDFKLAPILQLKKKHLSVSRSQLTPWNNGGIELFNTVISCPSYHYSDVIMTTMASQFTSRTIVYPIVYSDADQRKHQSSASRTLVRGIHRWPVNYPHKGPVTRKMFPFDDAIMIVARYNIFCISCRCVCS